jgi:hypothetical protein
MDDRSKSEVLRDNERLKLIASVLTNLGTALMATTAGRWFLTGFDGFVVLWLVCAVALIWTGVQSLGLLVGEPK